MAALAAASAPEMSAVGRPLHNRGVAPRPRLLRMAALLRHGGEDEVGGAVDDPENPAEPLSCERLGERADDGDPTADCCLKEKGDPRSPRPPRSTRRRLRGHQLLVRRYHGLAWRKARNTSSQPGSNPPSTRPPIGPRDRPPVPRDGRSAEIAEPEGRGFSTSRTATPSNSRSTPVLAAIAVAVVEQLARQGAADVPTAEDADTDLHRQRR